MFILMGETEKVSPLQQGQFDCPVCGGSQSYSIHQSTAYFTIFGISVARMSTLSHYLTCDCCTSCFSPQILEQPAQHAQAINQSALFRVLCYLLSGYGDTVQSRQRLLGIYKSRSQQDKSLNDIDNELDLITSGNAPTLPYLNDIMYLLSPVKKQQLVIAAYEFSNGSCMMEHHDRVRVNTIGSSLGLSLPEIEYLIVNR